MRLVYKTGYFRSTITKEGEGSEGLGQVCTFARSAHKNHTSCAHRNREILDLGKSKYTSLGQRYFPWPPTFTDCDGYEEAVNFLAATHRFDHPPSLASLPSGSGILRD